MEEPMLPEPSQHNPNKRKTPDYDYIGRCVFGWISGLIAAAMVFYLFLLVAADVYSS